MLSAFLENVTAILAFYPLTYISWRSEPECVRRIDISFPEAGIYPFWRLICRRSCPFRGNPQTSSVKVPILPRKENIVSEYSECRSFSRPQDHLDQEYTNTRDPAYAHTPSHAPDDEMILAREVATPGLFEEDPSNLHRSLYTCRGQLLHVSRFMVSRLENIHHPFSSQWERATLVLPTGRKI